MFLNFFFKKSLAKSLYHSCKTELSFILWFHMFITLDSSFVPTSHHALR